MRGHGAIARQLAELPVFAPLSKREQRTVAKAAMLLKVRAGEPVTVEDAIADGTYVVLSGRLSVSKAGEQVGTLVSGHLVGEIGVLEGRRSATVRAEVDSELLFLPEAVVTTLRDELPAFGAAVDEVARRRLNRDRYTE